MKAFLESVAVVVFVAFALALVFLLQGEPSLWDVLHAKAMAWARVRSPS